MAYYFICDYCNNEQTYYPYDPAEFEVECSECGEGLCVNCVESFEGARVCVSCFEDLSNPPKDQDA